MYVPNTDDYFEWASAHYRKLAYGYSTAVYDLEPGFVLKVTKTFKSELDRTITGWKSKLSAFDLRPIEEVVRETDDAVWHIGVYERCIPLNSDDCPPMLRDAWLNASRMAARQGAEIVDNGPHQWGFNPRTNEVVCLDRQVIFVGAEAKLVRERFPNHVENY